MRGLEAFAVVKAEKSTIFQLLKRVRWPGAKRTALVVQDLAKPFLSR
jgi:hypothetical protein